MFDAAHRAALESGKSLIYVCPPAPWAARPLFARLPAAEGEGLRLLVLAPETPGAVALGDSLGNLPSLAPVHPATGLARTDRLLRGGTVRTLVVTAPDALELLRRAVLKLEALPRMALAWPEAMLQLNHGPQLDTLLGEAPRAQRLVLTGSEPAIADFLERHAHRAPVLAAARLPPEPVGPVRYAVVEPSQVRRAVRAVLDILNPESAVVWAPPGRLDLGEVAGSLPGARAFEPGSGDTGHTVAIALDLPSAELLAALRAAAAEVVVLVSAGQVDYLARIAAPLKPLRLTTAPDQARDRLFALRQQLRDRIRGEQLSGALLALEPLFDEHDPALVAAALLAVPPRDAAGAGEDVPTWVRLRLNLGRRDNVRVSDVVGALLNAVRLRKEDVGRVDVRDAFSLVDVRAPVAEHTVRELNGMTLRGRRLVAAVDRH